MTYKKIFVSLTVYSLLIALITFVAMQFSDFLSRFSGWPFLLLVFYVINAGILFLLHKYSGKRAVKFINLFILTSFGSMLLYVVIMLVYVYINPTVAIPFVIVFLFYFMLFLLFEVYLLLKLNKNVPLSS